jgi:cell division protein FtsN
MFKILVFLIIIIVGVYLINNIFQLSLFSKSEIVHIKSDNLAREKILPRIVIENKKDKIEVKKPIVLEKQKVKTQENTISGLYLQLASYKNIEKAKKLISNYKESSNLILSKLNFSITTANISDRGTYYRVRVGPYVDVKDIYKLCLDLKVKNNECLIVKDKK